MKVMLPMPSQSVKSNTSNVMKSYPRPRWQDPEFTQLRHPSLNEIPVVKPSDIPGHHLKAYVNSLFDSICEGIHISVKMNIKQESTRFIRGPKRWFSSSCKAARNRNKLFHYIWKSCGRPNKVYECYRTACKDYRHCCRQAVQTKSQRITTLIETMYRERKSKKFWNLIRSTKQNPNAGDAIDTETLSYLL